ncbi:MFS transporter [Thalassovita aquimarina]|uniref:MFS transporter n=1 Tax=Thalassovita aquimarina TaxID=2785917 RepID=A0ABS5HW26_9RHOB|nr:MFS transporter [Thalassovita aquimarina]MBR9652987.1 MFS transporter [Thalassovita aquimarina]
MNSFSLFFVAFVIGLDEFLLGPLLTPIGNDLGVAPERIALLVATYNLPLALLAPVFGTLSDRIGRSRVIFPAAFLFSCASLFTAMAPSFGLALLARLLTGIAAAGMLPVAFAMASESEDSATAISRVQAGLTLGIILGPLNGALMDAIADWRMAFVTLAVASGFLAFQMKRSPRRTKLEAPGETGRIRAVQRALPGILAMLFGLGGAIGIFAIVGARIRDLHGFDTAQVSALFAGFGAMTVLGNLLAPQLIRMIGPRLSAGICLAAVLAGVFALFAAPGADFSLTLAGLGLWAIFGGCAAPSLQAALADTGGGNRGFILAMGASALNAGTALASALAAELHLLSAQMVAWQATMTLLPASLLLLFWGLRASAHETA